MGFVGVQIQLETVPGVSLGMVIMDSGGLNNLRKREGGREGRESQRAF